MINNYAKAIVQTPFTLGKVIDDCCAQCHREFTAINGKDKFGVKNYHCEGNNCKSYICYECYHSLSIKLCPICYSIYIKNKQSILYIYIIIYYYYFLDSTTINQSNE